MKIRFSKYQGAGNDFIIIDNRTLNWQPSLQEVSALCDRHFGVGADGLMLLDVREGFDFGMVYYNADGKESSMCGNGGRCLMAFAKCLGIGGERFKFLAIDGLHYGEHPGGSSDIYRLKMKDVGEIIEYDDGVFMNTGSPHFVKTVANAAVIDVYKEGKALRNDPRFAPGGSNVDFVEVSGNSLYVRTYERGVEGETLSCGTGVTASAIAVSSGNQGFVQPIRIDTSGGELYVTYRRLGSAFTDIWLEGPAKFVFSGEIIL